MLLKSAILEEIEKGNIVISDLSEDRIGPNSVDLTLGETSFAVIWDKHGPVFVGPQVRMKGAKVPIPVGGTLLGHTAEHITTKNGIVGVLWSPSSVARVCINTHFGAGLGDEGYDNKWTVELSASTLLGQPNLVVGGRVVQIVFFRGEGSSMTSYNGQYNDCDWPYCMIPKDYRNINHRVIKNHSVLAAMNSEYQ